MYRKFPVALCALAMLLFGCSRSNNQDLYTEIKSVNKMVFASMAITKTVFNNQHFCGRRIAAYSYDTYMRAYIDLSALQLDDLQFDDHAKTVKVTLPPVVTELTGRDIEMRNVYENITGVRDPLTEMEIAKLKEEGNTNLKKEIEENPMYKAHLIGVAQQKARKYFETIFENQGYVASIEFRNPDNSNKPE